MRDLSFPDLRGAIVASFVAAFLLLGCAQTTSRASISWHEVRTTIPEDRALVYFVRPSTLAAGLQTYRVFVNESAVVDLPTGRYASLLVAPGRVSVWAKTALTPFALMAWPTMVEKPALELELGAGSMTFVKVGVSFWGAPTLEIVPEEQGQSLVAGAEATQTSTR